MLIAISPKKSYCQINWNTISDTFTLSPNKIFEKGLVTISNTQSGASIQVNGSLEFLMKENQILFNDGNNVFHFKNSDILNIKLENYGRTFFADELFKKDFGDSILQHHRKTVYKNLGLNKIIFSLSKRNEYDFENSLLVLKNQKKIEGKLCYVGIDKIVILNENGDLNTIEDGDFNFLQMDQFKGFACKELYDHIFEKFQQNLDENIKEWKEKVSKKSLEDLIQIFGPMERIENIDADKKIIVWKKTFQSYYVNFSTNSYGFTSIHNIAATEINTYNDFFLGTISPFFIYGNNNRNTNLSIYSNTSITSNNSSSLSGSILTKDNGTVLSVVQDSLGKTIQVYQENIFSKPDYGSPFRFINF